MLRNIARSCIRPVSVISRPTVMTFKRLPVVFSRSMCESLSKEDQALNDKFKADIAAEYAAEDTGMGDWSKGDWSVQKAAQGIHELCTLQGVEVDSREVLTYLQTLNSGIAVYPTLLLELQPQTLMTPITEGLNQEDDKDLLDFVGKMTDPAGHETREKENKELLEKILLEAGFPASAANVTGDTEVPSDAGAIARSIVDTMIDDGSIVKLPEIVASLENEITASSSTVNCVVTSAVELAEEAQAKIAAKLNAYAQKRGETCNISYETDPSVLGGFFLNYGSNAQDLTAATSVAEFIDDMKSYTGEK